MNVKEYISTGIIESYVMGMTTEAEAREFEALQAQYPEIASARDAFERSLEERLLQDAPPPPAFLKERIRASLDAVQASADADEAAADEAPVRRLNPWKWVAAATVILLAGSLYWAVTTNNKYESLRAENARTEALQAELDQTKAALTALQQDASTLQKPGMKMASLKGTPDAPTAQVTVAWDTTSKDVYLIVNNLPQPASDQQYQLWALLGGKPVDLGVFDVRQEKLLLKMKNAQNAEAFAITLERKGGSPTPAGTMTVYGKL
ncbi:MAG: anti-sigma factor [Flaviaesturariibacter sp.]|nr:anti-sigma factor [Flaviaesturariibacter sp.]